MPADLGLSDDGHAIVHAERAGAPGGEVRGEVGMSAPAGLDVAVGRLPSG